MDVYGSSSPPPLSVLDSVEGETHFFRALMRARPVGIHRHFHVLAMQASIERGINQQVPIEDIWNKLEACYNLDALENLEADNDTSTPGGSQSSSPDAVSSSKEEVNTGPVFHEFSIPRGDTFIESLLADRRVRTSPSPSPSPSQRQSPSGSRDDSPSAAIVAVSREREKDRESRMETRKGRRRKAGSRATMAGLVSGDSDSSDLTVQSADDPEGEGGEEEAAGTPSERRASASEGESDEEEREEDAPSKPRRGRRPGRGRGRASSLRRRKR